MSRRNVEKLKRMGMRIIREAKRLRKKHPRWSWKTCMKEAGKKFRKKRRKRR